MRNFATKLIKLHLSVTDTNTQIETTPGDERHRRGIFRHPHGVGQWQQHQVGTQTHALRPSRDSCVDD